MRVSRFLALGAMTAALAVPVTAVAAPPKVNQADLANVTKEAAARAAEAEAEETGALGTYIDSATGDIVSVFPKGAQIAALRSVAGVTARFKTASVDEATIETISAELEALQPLVAKQGFSYGFGFDPESGVIQVDSEAPESAFAAVTGRYPGLIRYRKATFEPTSWDNDSPPHWGGAWIQSNARSCTSGWAMEDNNNHRWMVTAGHCFPRGVSTNMGSSIRDDAWDFSGLDVARITGHSYAGRIYADGANGDRIIRDGNDPVIGSSYCTTGRTSGFVCGWTLRGKNKTVCYDDPDINRCIHKLASFTRANGAPVQKGDSGGPLFIKDGSNGVGIRGIVQGRSLVDPDRIGTWTSYAQQYHSIADFYVSHVVTP